MIRLLRICYLYKKELKNFLQIYDMIHQQVRDILSLSQFLYLYIKFKCSFNISFQVQRQQEKNINIHGILLQLRHTNELFRDSEIQEITSTILTMK